MRIYYWFLFFVNTMLGGWSGYRYFTDPTATNFTLGVCLMQFALAIAIAIVTIKWLTPKPEPLNKFGRPTNPS